MTNTALARFIASLGTLNGYGSTVYQTKLALDRQSPAPLRQDNSDVAIFTDALKGIAAVEATGFSAAGIIAINRAFDSPSPEEPAMPGHLRSAYYNPDDKTAILLDAHGKEAYFPPDVVTQADLEAIVAQYRDSAKAEADAWRVFARLAKLQPFQDGNKRTALIAANAAYDTLTSGDYLLLPQNDLDRAEFMIALMRFYQATDPAGEDQAFARLLTLLPSPDARRQALAAPITPDDPGTLATRRIKRTFR
ncbi:Fic family protein [Lacticaseibacillus suihuaensis]